MEQHIRFMRDTVLGGVGALGKSYKVVTGPVALWMGICKRDSVRILGILIISTGSNMSRVVIHSARMLTYTTRISFMDPVSVLCVGRDVMRTTVAPNFFQA